MKYSRLHITLILMAAVSLLGFSTPPRADAAAGSYVPGEVLVKLVLATDLPAVAAKYKLNRTPIDRFGTRPIYRMRMLDGVSPPRRAEAMEQDSRVLYAEPNYLEQAPEWRQRSSWSKGEQGAYTG